MGKNLQHWGNAYKWLVIIKAHKGMSNKRSDNLNKYQKYLNERARRLFKSKDCGGRTYRECRIGWNIALQNIKVYKLLLERLNIIKR